MIISMKIGIIIFLLNILNYDDLYENWHDAIFKFNLIN